MLARNSSCLPHTLFVSSTFFLLTLNSSWQGWLSLSCTSLREPGLPKPSLSRFFCLPLASRSSQEGRALCVSSLPIPQKRSMPTFSLNRKVGFEASTQTLSLAYRQWHHDRPNAARRPAVVSLRRAVRRSWACCRLSSTVVLLYSQKLYRTSMICHSHKYLYESVMEIYQNMQFTFQFNYSVGMFWWTRFILQVLRSNTCCPLRRKRKYTVKFVP